MPHNAAAPRLLRSTQRIREICDAGLEPREALIVRAALDIILIAFHEIEARLQLRVPAAVDPATPTAGQP